MMAVPELFWAAARDQYIVTKTKHGVGCGGDGAFSQPATLLRGAGGTHALC